MRCVLVSFLPRRLPSVCRPYSPKWTAIIRDRTNVRYAKWRNSAENQHKAQQLLSEISYSIPVIRSSRLSQTSLNDAAFGLFIFKGIPEATPLFKIASLRGRELPLPFQTSVCRQTLERTAMEHRPPRSSLCGEPLFLPVSASAFGWAKTCWWEPNARRVPGRVTPGTAVRYNKTESNDFIGNIGFRKLRSNFNFKCFLKKTRFYRTTRPLFR